MEERRCNVSFFIWLSSFRHRLSESGISVLTSIGLRAEIEGRKKKVKMIKAINKEYDLKLKEVSESSVEKGSARDKVYSKYGI